MELKTVLVSISAKNLHKQLAAWCLNAYCQQNGIKNISVVETNINDNINQTIGKVFLHNPNIIGFSCYIWNIDYVKKAATTLKQLMPSVIIVLGGPEVWFEKDLTNYPFADYIVCGQGEQAFYDLLCGINEGRQDMPRVINGGFQDFKDFATPFNDQYFESFSSNQIPDIANQLVYYESSRGCQFSCSYCLSSAIDGVHCLDLDRVKSELMLLVKNGAKCIKFVDRTFNADKQRAIQILTFVASLDTDCCFHFEVAADLFDGQLLDIIKDLPVGRVQFEIGVQSTNLQTLRAVNRATDIGVVLENIKKLTAFNNCHIHLDLIAGLPHDSLQTFSEAFDRCIECNPHMLQLGFLKMLKGTKIREESQKYDAVYCDFAPYEVCKNHSISFDEILLLKKIEGITDRYYNSGFFAKSLRYGFQMCSSAFEFFKQFSEYLGGTEYKSSLKNAYKYLLNFLCEIGDSSLAAHYIKLDCLTHDRHATLPDTMQCRHKQAELDYYKKYGKDKLVRIEYFEYDGKYRLFDYSDRHKVLNSYNFQVVDTGNI